MGDKKKKDHSQDYTIYCDTECGKSSERMLARIVLRSQTLDDVNIARAGRFF